MLCGQFDVILLKLQGLVENNYTDMDDRFKTLQKCMGNDLPKISYCLDDLCLICACEVWFFKSFTLTWDRLFFSYLLSLDIWTYELQVFILSAAKWSYFARKSVWLKPYASSLWSTRGQPHWLFVLFLSYVELFGFPFSVKVFPLLPQSLCVPIVFFLSWTLYSSIDLSI